MQQERFVDLVLPTFHEDQERAFWLQGRFKAIRCGRRWGKTMFAEVIAGDALARGQIIGFFAPDYKILSETFNEMADTLAPISLGSSRVHGVIRTMGGGRADFWTLNNERAGRSRKYHGIIIDEAAFTDKDSMMGIWEKAIRPTLLDYRGWALVCSNTNGNDSENFFWRVCNQKELGFVEYHAPSHANPYLPKDELERLERDNHPLVYQQEYLAEFVDWSGVAFFSLGKLLDANGEPFAMPPRCDSIFAVIDSAVKTGSENDGTGVVYCALDSINKRLLILDWDVVQIEGALLETWLPVVFQNCEAFAAKCRARMGAAGVWIEDKSSGMILLQQAKRRNLNVHSIDSDLTSVGKDERAISVSGYVHRERVKLCHDAYHKVSTYKGTTRNHLISQVVGFRIGDKDASKRDDDLLDCFTYGIAIGLGNEEGF